MYQWNGFKEKMDHELDRKPNSTVHLSLLREGYKLDGNGIKKQLGFNSLKSVDYIAENNALALVEFSDLYSQQNVLLSLSKTLYKSQAISNKDTKQINKKLWQTIQKELTDKYKDTLLIIEQMQKNNFCSKLEEHYKNDETVKKYWIIVSPFHPDIKEENKPELARFLDNLKDNIATSLPNKWNIKVQIIFIENFSKPK